MEGTVEFQGNRFRAEIKRNNEIKASLEGKYSENVVMKTGQSEKTLWIRNGLPMNSGMNMNFSTFTLQLNNMD